MVSDPAIGNRPGNAAHAGLVAALAHFTVLMLLCPPIALSETLFEAASSNGKLRVTVSLEPFPATCAHPVVLTVSAVTSPESVVDFGNDPTGETHLDLQAFTRAGTLSPDGRTITRSRHIAYLADFPGRTRIAGRTIAATTPGRQPCSVTIPDVPIDVIPIVPDGVDPELRDIAPLMPLTVRPWKRIATLSASLLLGLSALGLATLFLRRCRRKHWLYPSRTATI